MYRTGNFEILVPSQEPIKVYHDGDIEIEEGLPMARHNQDTDIFIRIEEAWTRKCIQMWMGMYRPLRAYLLQQQIRGSKIR